jgi:hypothetical protein
MEDIYRKFTNNILNIMDEYKRKMKEIKHEDSFMDKLHKLEHNKYGRHR